MLGQGLFQYEGLVSFLTYFESLFSSSPYITSRIIQGSFYTPAVLEFYKEGLLLAPGLDLAPAHVNCARIIFLNTNLKAIHQIAMEEGVSVFFDNYPLYGTEGRPILPANS